MKRKCTDKIQNGQVKLPFIKRVTALYFARNCLHLL